MTTIEVNDKSFKEGLSISTALAFALQAGGIGLLASIACESIDLPNAKQFLVPCAVILYLFYALATMTKEQLKANAKAKMQALESELQALKEKEQALVLDKHLLSQSQQALSNKLANADQVCANALLDLANAQEELKQALADKERALKNAYALHEEALQKAQNEGKIEALKWRKLYEALRAEVDEANAQKEVQTLTATVRNRYTAKTGRIWSEEDKAKHNEQLDRLRSLGVDVTLWTV